MPIVTLLSDFGSGSPYPGEMRGVLRSCCRATLVDLTHDIPALDIAQGAYVLAQAAWAFPAGTVHLAVVDPGVGTGRRAIAMVSGGQFFVGPDNGLLVPAARALGRARAVAIAAERYARRPLSATFHGRDLFAPAAGALARGVPIDELGPAIASPVEIRQRPPERRRGRLEGGVMFVDAFGNLTSNIPAPWLDDLPATVSIAAAGRTSAARRVRTYGDAPAGELVVLAGSGGTVEIAVPGGRAADRLGLRPGDRVALRATDRPGRGARPRPEQTARRRRSG
jgi:S-adenosylmethionine hydrolase